jgi:hypothetical protein
MRRFVGRFYRSLPWWLVALPSLGTLAAAAVSPPDVSSGEALARQLRSAEPEESSEIQGTLIIHADKQIKNVPVVCRVRIKGPVWETDYETSATAATPAEHLEVAHSTNGPNDYLFARASAPGEPLPKLTAAAPADAADISLAGSDFSLADLGMEFLHWPGQQRFGDQDRLDRSCYVLESRNPAAHGIVRVKSYIDKDTGGLLLADAYDAGGRLVKEFSLHGSSFKKVNGHWRLEKMEISNRKTHSRTELRFNVDSE